MGGGRGGPSRRTGAEGIEDSSVATLTVASHLKKRNGQIIHFFQLDSMVIPAARLEVGEFEGVGEVICWSQGPRHILPCSTVLKDNLVDQGWKGL